MKVGQPVVFKQGDVEGPLTRRDLRIHPALVAAVHPGDMLDLVVLPLEYGGVRYALFVPKYQEGVEGRCWEEV